MGVAPTKTPSVTNPFRVRYEDSPTQYGLGSRGRVRLLTPGPRRWGAEVASRDAGGDGIGMQPLTNKKASMVHAADFFFIPFSSPLYPCFWNTCALAHPPARRFELPLTLPPPPSPPPLPPSRRTHRLQGVARSSEDYLLLDAAYDMDFDE